MQRNASCVLIALLALSSLSLAQTSQSLPRNSGIEHVLLISIDGMHAVDFLNCWSAGKDDFAAEILGAMRSTPYLAWVGAVTQIHSVSADKHSR